MLTINDLANKMIVMIDGAPFQVLEVRHLHVGRGGSSVQTRIRNLITGQTFSRNFKPADSFEEADVVRRQLRYLFAHRGEYTFAAEDTTKRERFVVKADWLGDTAQWLIPNTVVTALFLVGKLVSVTVPIKMDFRVSEAPPNLKGDTASGSTKVVVIATRAKISTPLFVNAGDVIRVNTETGEYVERVTKI